MNTSTSIIFGGTGFIGSHLSKILDNHVIYDIAENPLHDVRKQINIDVYSETLEDIKVIYNLAAIHKTPGHKSHEYFETNILGAENVCNFAREHDINTIIFTSSIAPYGASEDLKSEETLAMPNTPYGISKYIAEEIHRRWLAEDPYTRKLIILRPGIVFGRGEGGNFTRLYQSLKKKMFFYAGRSNTLKSAIYVKDLTRIMVAMSERESPGYHLYNMCYPEPHTIKEIVRAVSEVTKVSKSVPVIPGILLKSVASIIYFLGASIGINNMTGIHPNRVSKLMISTNISGRKLNSGGYSIKYSLKEAIEDWYVENHRKELL